MFLKISIFFQTLLLSYVKLLFTSGIRTRNPVDARVPTARATQNIKTFWKNAFFINGAMHPPTLATAQMRVTKPIPYPQATKGLNYFI